MTTPCGRRYDGISSVLAMIIEATTLAESLKALENNPDIDILLADVVLPDGQCLELLTGPH